MTYHADQTNKPGTIQSWFYATAPAGTEISLEADDHFTFYPLRNPETGLPATISGSTPTPGAPSATFTPANAAGTVISGSRTKYFYTLRNEGAAGYFKASGFTDVERFDTSAHFLTVRGNAHGGRVCEWLGEMGYAVNADTVPAWLTLSLDTSGASYTAEENATGAERVADVEFMAYSGQSMAVQIRQLAKTEQSITITQRTEWRPAAPPAGTPAQNFKLVSYSPDPLYTNHSGYVSFRYTFDREWTQAEYRITEYKLPDGTAAKPAEETPTGNTKQVSQTFTESNSQHKAGATDPNISGAGLNLYSRSGNLVGAATLTSTGGGGGGGGGGTGGGGGGTGGGTGGGVPDPGEPETPPTPPTPGEIPENTVAIEFSALGGVHALTLPASQADRTVFESASADWLSYGVAGISCAPHTEKDARTGTVSFRRESLVDGVWTTRSRTVYTVTQRGIFYVEPEALTFPPQGGEAVVEFKNETPVLISPANGEFLYGKFDLSGNAKVYFYPVCVHAGTTPAAVSFDVTYTAEDGQQTAPLTVTVNPPTRTERSLTVTPSPVPASGGTVTVTALYPENETCGLSIGGVAGFLTKTGKTETPGSTVWTFEAAENIWNTAQEASLTVLFFSPVCDHDGAETATVTLLSGDETPGEGEDSGGDDGGSDRIPVSPGDTPAPVLSLTCSSTRLSSDAGTFTLTAVFNDAVNADSVRLFLPEEAGTRLSVRGEPVTDGNTKTWTLAIAANREAHAREYTLAVFTETLAASVKITQADFPRRAAAFYRNKRLWKPTFF